MPGLDDWLPEFDARERHERVVPLPPAAAMARALALPAGCDFLVRLFLRARGMRADIPLGRFFREHGFEELERTPTSLVVGMSGRPWRPGPGVRPLDLAEAGMVRIVADIRAEPHPDGSRVSTETRVAAVDRAARRRFRAYWLAIHPLSALIRRRWLRAIARAAAEA